MRANSPAVTLDGRLTMLSEVSEAWHAAWDDLAINACEPNPYYERWFLQAACNNLDPLGQIRLMTVWHQSLLIGLLPLKRAARYGRMPVGHIENWLHYHCFCGVPLVREGFEDRFWAGALQMLDADRSAGGLLHLVGLVRDGPLLAALKRSRRTDTVHITQRAMLRSTLRPDAYYAKHVRQKKRKEISRLRLRLAELGTVSFERWTDGSVEPWVDDFLALEAAGWKGRNGSALGMNASTGLFFRTAIVGAQESGRLEMLRLTLNTQPIAMLVNFHTPPGSFSFKIAFDEEFGRFSPGVLIQIENLQVLDHKTIDWMDSCASEDNSMINSLWAERREIVRVTVPLAGVKRKALFHGVRALESAAAFARSLQ